LTHHSSIDLFLSDEISTGDRNNSTKMTLQLQDELTRMCERRIDHNERLRGTRVARRDRERQCATADILR
jgi:hypothetical protein